MSVKLPSLSVVDDFAKRVADSSVRILVVDTELVKRSKQQVLPSNPSRGDPTATPAALYERTTSVGSAGILEGITMIERDAYAAIAQRGGSQLRRVLTAGGGAKNEAWTEMRQRALGVPVCASPNGALLLWQRVAAQLAYYQ
jgi:hypothetical protein